MSESAPLFFLDGDEGEGGTGRSTGLVQPSKSWKRRYLGTFVLSAYSMTKGSDYIQPGDRVLIQRKKKPAKVSGRGGARARERPDYVVRFSDLRGTCLRLRRVRNWPHPRGRGRLDVTSVGRRSRGV